MATHTFSDDHGALMQEAYGRPPLGTPPAAPEAPPPAETPAASAPAPAEPAAPASDAPPDPVTPPVEEAAAAADEDEDEEEETPAAAPVPDITPGIQRRFNRFRRQLGTLERQNLTLEQALTASRAQIETLTQLLGSQSAPTRDAPPASPPVLREEDFPSHDAYLRAVIAQETERVNSTIDARVQEALRARDTQAATQAALSAQQAQVQQWQASVDAAQSHHADFDEVVSAVDTIPISQALMDGVRESPNGGELYYYLASHPAEIGRLSLLPPAALYRELGKLEATLTPAEASPPARGPTRPAARPPSRPTPIRPVGGASNAQPVVERGKLPMKDYIALRDKERHRT